MTISISHDHVGISITPEVHDATVDWYARHFGFQVERSFSSHGTTFTFLVSGNAKIELLTGATRETARTENVLTSMDPSRLHHLCFAVEDLDAAVTALHDRGVELIGGPMEIDAIGQRIAFVTDNVGTIIELSEPGTWPGGRRS